MFSIDMIATLFLLRGFVTAHEAVFTWKMGELCSFFCVSFTGLFGGGGGAVSVFLGGARGYLLFTTEFGSLCTLYPAAAVIGSIAILYVVDFAVPPIRRGGLTNIKLFLIFCLFVWASMVVVRVRSRFFYILLVYSTSDV